MSAFSNLWMTPACQKLMFPLRVLPGLEPGSSWRYDAKISVGASEHLFLDAGAHEPCRAVRLKNGSGREHVVRIDDLAPPAPEDEQTRRFVLNGGGRGLPRAFEVR